MDATLYARDRGPQCFEAEIIVQQESAEAFVQQLRECGLTWYWHSVREKGRRAVPGQPELPRYRALTLLTDQSCHDLILDIDEEADTPNIEHRNLMLFGLDAEISTPVEASLDEATKRFLQDLGPLEIVFDRVQDLTCEFLYFRHQMTPEVRCLLKAWQLDPVHAPKVRPYKKLGISQLESFLPDMMRWYR